VAPVSLCPCWSGEITNENPQPRLPVTRRGCLFWCQVADLHAELEEAEALLGLAGLGGGDAEHDAGEREREGRDQDSTIQALEEQVRQLQGQVRGTRPGRGEGTGPAAPKLSTEL
jgi:hypothetical protein